MSSGPEIGNYVYTMQDVASLKNSIADYQHQLDVAMEDYREAIIQYNSASQVLSMAKDAIASAKNNTGAPPAPTYTTIGNGACADAYKKMPAYAWKKAMPGADLDKTCQAYCNAMGNCIGYNAVKSSNMCFLYSNSPKDIPPGFMHAGTSTMPGPVALQSTAAVANIDSNSPCMVKVVPSSHVPEQADVDQYESDVEMHVDQINTIADRIDKLIQILDDLHQRVTGVANAYNATMMEHRNGVVSASMDLASEEATLAGLKAEAALLTNQMRSSQSRFSSQKTAIIYLIGWSFLLIILAWVLYYNRAVFYSWFDVARSVTLSPTTLDPQLQQNQLTAAALEAQSRQ